MLLGPIAPSRSGQEAPGGLSYSAALGRLPWRRRLRDALASDSFVLHFQPIVCLHDDTIAHHEALLRLRDCRDGSLTAPGSFLPAAEGCGLILEIDRMVLTKVAAILGSAPGTSIAMNLSALSVTDGRMLGEIDDALAREEVDPARLVVEITETAAIGDIAAARDFCAGLISLGCGVALDDFGAGYGSFMYLKHLPFTHLKIDGDFIRSLPDSRTDQLVVEAIAGVVRGMGRETIAEFVADQRTIELLREYGVGYAQGFELGRPSASVPVAA